MVHRTLLQLAEAVSKAAPKPRLRKAAVELTDKATERIKTLLENRHKVRTSSLPRHGGVLVSFFSINNKFPVV
jgi:hypothetical protein